MTVIQDIYNKLMDCCIGFSTPFTTADVIERFSQKYEEDWNNLEKKYGEGGEGCGRYFTAHVYIGQMLRRLSDQSKIKSLDFTDAPKGWGNPVIALYRNFGSSTQP